MSHHKWYSDRTKMTISSKYRAFLNKTQYRKWYLIKTTRNAMFFNSKKEYPRTWPVFYDQKITKQDNPNVWWIASPQKITPDTLNMVRLKLYSQKTKFRMSGYMIWKKMTWKHSPKVNSRQIYLGTSFSVWKQRY